MDKLFQIGEVCSRLGWLNLRNLVLKDIKEQ